MRKEVSVYTMTLEQIFEKGINIPDYQRIYCWRDKNVFHLLDDIWSLEENRVYHLGSIILQKDTINDKQVLNIIDGQQRLITLSLIFQVLDDLSSPLLQQEIKSSEARKFVGYNKFLIRTYISKYKLLDDKKREKVNILKKALRLTVLILESSVLDLAYTFFSNQNNQGIPLSNYDLLKSHHLRFINDEYWAQHLAQKWDKIIKEDNEGVSHGISTSLGLYLFRLRNWLYSNVWDENYPYKIKEEFEASKTITEIPPFGERFNFNESIQGGTHFFAYTEYFIDKCRNFQQTLEYKCLKIIGGESHYWFREVIETMLFAYYLKFGTSYLSEALICISRIISEIRLENSRVYKTAVLNSKYNKDLLHFIDKSTSPTFFLAECKALYKRFPIFEKNVASPIQKRFYNLLQKTHSKIESSNLCDSFKNELIKE